MNIFIGVNMDYLEKSLDLHYKLKGKLEIKARTSVNTMDDLSMAYTPGVAQPCLEIQKDINKSFELTRRWNTVAVITDGSAVLGLGDIGPEAAMPVMEGKCVLFKKFGDIDAFPICIRSKDVNDIISAVALIAGSFGGINLEDISAPRCFEIEQKLKKCTDIPIFHDDQHGTAVVTVAALINALKLTNRTFADSSFVISGAGAAGTAVAKLIKQMGAKNIISCDIEGIVCRGDRLNGALAELASWTNPSLKKGTLADAIIGSDVFIGVSAPNIVSKEMIESMNKNPIVLPMANPVPEIMPDLALKAGAAVVGTGRSDFPNQINNVLAFPGIFRGALNVRASDINEEMKIAAADALASLISSNELTSEYILPKAFDERVGPTVAKAVAQAAINSGVARIT